MVVALTPFANAALPVSRLGGIQWAVVGVRVGTGYQFAAARRQMKHRPWSNGSTLGTTYELVRIW